MEVYTSFLLLMLTWTAPQTFCKSLNKDGKPGNTDADGQMIADQAGDMLLMENQIPSGMRETAPGVQDIEVVNGEPLKDESGNISGRDQVVFSYDNKTGRKEVEMSFGDSSPEERTGTGMVLVGDMWLNQDQLPRGPPCSNFLQSHLLYFILEQASCIMIKRWAPCTAFYT